MFLGCFFTIAVYTFVFIRIKIYKATGDKHLRSKLLEALDKKSLTDYLTTLFYIIFVCIHLVLILKINSLDSSKMHVYPNYLCLFFCLSVCLFVCLSVFLFVCLSVCMSIQITCISTITICWWFQSSVLHWHYFIVQEIGHWERLS